jgi:lipoyl(octanoyl) transferase
MNLCVAACADKQNSGSAQGINSRVIFDELELWEDGVARSAAENMACDEALSQVASGRAVLRVYRWGAAAVTFGYSQRVAEALSMAGGREVMRRWTGGGIVEHGEDLTFGLVFPRGSVFGAMGGEAIYRELHGAWLPQLGNVAAGAEMAGSGVSRAAGVCFSEPVAGDLLVDGRKVLGGAMRRTARDVVYQGSLLAKGVGAVTLAEAIGKRVRVFRNEGRVVAAAEGLVLEKYGTEAWLHKR